MGAMWKMIRLLDFVLCLEIIHVPKFYRNTLKIATYTLLERLSCRTSVCGLLNIVIHKAIY